MKPLSLLTCSIVPLAGLIGMATADPFCWRMKYALDKTWKISIAPLPKEEIGPLCHRFWQNLKRHRLCGVQDPHGCGPWTNGTYHGKAEHGVQWEFTTTHLCNGGMVESAYWEATKNKYGAIDCHK